jgi:type 2 lantibiotic biosynthesis protein LanM
MQKDLEAQLKREGWTLHQRLGAAAKQCTEAGDPQPAEVLTAWRQLVGPDNPSNFDKRLDWDGLTPAQAAWALDPPTYAVPQQLAWWPVLEHLRQAGRDAANGNRPEPLSDRSAKQPFVHIWRPAAAWALETLKVRCNHLWPRLQLAEAAWLDLGDALLERLCHTADQALWELFNQRRTPGQMLLAHLGADGNGSGDPVHEAYDGFVQELLSSGYGLLLAKYPVLGRLLAVVTQLWIEAGEEMLCRLADSRSELEQHFGISATALVHHIQLGLSDPHRGGRAVAILSFSERREDGEQKVVYKPKDMQVDLAYQAYLRKLNTSSSLPPLRCLTILTRPCYGFMEWVEHQVCTSDEQLACFYTNAGRTMAVLHLLGCTDCHYENLIASGDQLLLTDTETLLEADVKDLINDDGDDPNKRSQLQTSLQGSVLRSGLLPHWQISGAGGRRVYDISALGIQPPPPEQNIYGWLGLNSDGMMAGKIRQASELPTSLPVGLGFPQRLTEFADHLCDGFHAQLQESLRLRPFLLDLLESFKGKPRRLVARSTRLYFTIQRQMLEPAALRNAVQHGLKLEQLCRSFVLASVKPNNWNMFHAEVNQMEQLDIPFYEHLVDGEDLPLPGNLDSILAFMTSSGLRAARKRLEALDADEIQFQQQLIRGSVAARHLSTAVSYTPEDPSQLHGEHSSGNQELLGADSYCAEAFKIGEELWATAIHDRKGRPEWLGMDLGADGESFHFGLIGSSLYSGTSGIGVLLAKLAQVCQARGDAAGAALWRQRAWSTLAPLADLAERKDSAQLFRLVRDLPYGIAGSGGILLTLNLLMEVGLGDAAPLANQLIAQLRRERVLADQGLDVISGITGLIGPLLQLGSAEALSLAFICGERLLESQLESGGWPQANVRKPALTGFSHGAAGMAAALARLAQATDQDRFAAAAQRAVAYERSVYVAASGNWPDFRSTSEPLQFMLSWCHGAPGILLSRLVLRASGLADGACESELAAARSSTTTALETLSGKVKPGPAHLCCGDFGLTSLLRIDALISGCPLPPIVAQVESTQVGQAQINRHYTFFSVDSGSLNLPGLLTGKAGVALALLEAVDGQRWVPQVLSAGLLEMG